MMLLSLLPLLARAAQFVRVAQFAGFGCGDANANLTDETFVPVDTCLRPAEIGEYVLPLHSVKFRAGVDGNITQETYFGNTVCRHGPPLENVLPCSLLSLNLPGSRYDNPPTVHGVCLAGRQAGEPTGEDEILQGAMFGLLDDPDEDPSSGWCPALQAGCVHTGGGECVNLPVFTRNASRSLSLLSVDCAAAADGLCEKTGAFDGAPAPFPLPGGGGNDEAPLPCTTLDDPLDMCRFKTPVIDWPAPGTENTDCRALLAGGYLSFLENAYGGDWGEEYNFSFNRGNCSAAVREGKCEGAFKAFVCGHCQPCSPPFPPWGMCRSTADAMRACGPAWDACFAGFPWAAPWKEPRECGKGSEPAGGGASIFVSGAGLGRGLAAAVALGAAVLARA